MDMETARQEVRFREPNFLNPAKRKVNGRITYICPECENGSGMDGDGITFDPKADYPHWKCYKCGLYEDVIGLWKCHTGYSDDRDVFMSLYDYYGIDVELSDRHTELSENDRHESKIKRHERARNSSDSLLWASVNNEQMTMAFDGMNQNVIPVSQEIMQVLTNIVNQHDIADYVPNYSGNSNGNTMEILQKIWNCSERDVLNNTGIMMEYQLHPERFQTEQPRQDYSNFFLQANQNLMKTDYHRGLTLATLNHFCVGFVPDWRHPKAPQIVPASPRLIIPTSKYSYLARDTRENLTKIQKKYSKSKVGAVQIFNVESLHTAEKPIFVVEGEIDALSIIDVGGEAIALGSTSNVNKLLEILERKKLTQPLIISLDNDKAGVEASQRLTDGLQELGVSYHQINIAEPYKDANEALNADRESFADKVEEVEMNPEESERLVQEIKYMETAVSSHLQEFLNGIANSVNTPYIPTKFKVLDAVLDGGLYEGLYVVGAISSLGKTTFFTQICDQIAQSGHDVLIFSLEMARTELMAKSISRLTVLDVLQNQGSIKDAKTSRGITTGSRYTNYSQREKDLIQRAVQSYGKFADNIFIHEGIGDIGVERVREVVHQHISITGREPVVLIDYLQILAPADVRATDKQNTDKAVIELKRLSRDFKIPVIAISSFNRENYTAPVNLSSFKESGAIEYSSDVLIGLQLQGVGRKNFDATKEKAKNPREVELVILKNRNGATGKKIKYHYYPMFNYFEEMGIVTEDEKQ